MKPMERRQFLKMAGAGAAAVAAGAVTGSVVELIVAGSERRIRFTATAGLPRPPLPAYASYILDGEIDLRTRTGVISSILYAGPPGATSALTLPGMSRRIGVTAIREGNDGTLFVSGVVDRSSDILPGENSNVEFALVRANRTAEARFFGHPVEMHLVETSR